MSTTNQKLKNLELTKVYAEREGLTLEEAVEQISDIAQDYDVDESPESVEDFLGDIDLEPDYIFDAIDYINAATS